VPPARVLLASAATLAVVAALQPSVRALWQSNVGAFRQTRVELSVYRWPEWPIQDAVRTSRAELLADAVAHYKRALALNPQNAPAIRRLGQIELSLGQFDSARRHLVSAYRSAPNHQATGQLYGESLAVTGEPARAAKVWQGLHVEGNRIEIREWWHRNASDRQRAQWMSEAVALTTARSASQDRSTSPAPR
jgi:tetratricopeptide (TPR) repeat protein